MKNTLLALIAGLSIAACGGEKLVKNGDRIVFMGDSITRYGGDNPHGYVNLTVQGLAANGIAVEYFDAGVPGEVAAEMRARFTKDVVARQPDVVTICAGVNDIYFDVGEVSKEGKPVSTPNDVIAMIETAQQNGIRPVAMTPTFAVFQTENCEVTESYAATLRTYAQEHGVALADTWQAVRDWRDDANNPYLDSEVKYKVTTDGIHMAPAGNRVMARTLLRAFGLDDDEMAKAEAAWNANEGLCAFHPVVKISKAQLATFKQAADNSGLGGGEFAKVVFKRGLESLAQSPSVEAQSAAADAETFSAAFSVSFADYDTLLRTTAADAYKPPVAAKSGYIDATANFAMLRGIKECEIGEPVTREPVSVDPASFAKSIVFTASGYAGSSTLVDFPVAVRLASGAPAGFSYADMADPTSGAEIRFADSNGKSLDYDIEEWNPSGASIVWVRVPSLTKETSFTMYYGGTPSDAVTPSRTWSADYVGVWHMAENGGDVADASGNGLAAKPDGVAADAQVAGEGVFGRARVNSANRNHTTGRALLKVIDSYLLDVGNDFTMSSWVKMTDSIDGSYARVAVRSADGSATNPNWEMSLTGYDSAVVFGSAGSSLTGSVPSTQNAWVHLVAVYNGGTVSVYTNGAVAFSGAVTAATDCNYSLCFGTKPGAYNGHFTGLFDEFRLRDAVASADWVKAEFDQASGSFLTTGAQPAEEEGSEQPGEQPSIPPVSTSWTTVHGSFAKRVAFTASGYAGSSALENFPVLVRLSTAISGFDYADCPGGANIVFADANDNLLPHEIDTWDESGTSLVWVNVASLAKDAVFYMYFKGTPSAANAPAAAWNANYVGVWHMAEANGDVADATGHGLAAAASVTQTTGDQTAGEGVFGKARINGTGATFRRLTVPNYNDRGVGNTFTMSGWIRQTAASSEVRLFARKNNWAEAKGWSCLLMDSTTLNIVGASADSANKLVATIPSALDGWVHLAVVFDGTTATVYANGAAGESGAIKAATDSGNNLYFGSNSASNGTNFRGLFDECRLLDAVASADWVKAEYDQSSASFLAAGTVEINENPPEEPGDDPEQPGDDPEQPGDDPEQPGDDPEQPAASGWETAHGSFAKRMTFKASGYAGSSTLENFPVAVRLSTAIKGFDYADCGENGANIVFTDANDALLPHEIDTWDATGTSLVWVNVASLAKDAVFYMYFKGTPSAANAPAAAWNGDYVGVWHMGEASGDVADSTSGGFTASPAGTDKTVSGNHVAGEGVFGNGHVNATAAKKATYLKTAAATDFYVGSTFTVSGWVKLSTAPSSSIPVFSNRYAPAYQPGWDVCLASDTTLTVRGASTSDNLSGTLPSSCKDAWVHLTVVYSGSTATVYANGAAVTMSGSFTAASNPNNGTGLSFGGYNTAYYGASPIGLFDEFRFRKVAATADWVKAEYDQAGTSFLAVGAVETSGVKKPGVTLYIY